jgi:hypothetical protein
MHAACGVSFQDADLTGYDIPGTGKLAENSDRCVKFCQQTAGCNAVVYKKLTTKECWPKHVPEGGPRMQMVENPDSVSILLCPNHTLAMGDDLAVEETSGIAVSVVVVACLCAAAVVAWCLFMWKKKATLEKGDKHSTKGAGEAQTVCHQSIVSCVVQATTSFQLKDLVARFELSKFWFELSVVQ